MMSHTCIKIPKFDSDSHTYNKIPKFDSNSHTVSRSWTLMMSPTCIKILGSNSDSHTCIKIPAVNPQIRKPAKREKLFVRINVRDAHPCMRQYPCTTVRHLVCKHHYAPSKRTRSTPSKELSVVEYERLCVV